ncbi:MAG: HAD family hydrolase, partial [Bacteroidaceae bacterium]|nr:HAD family hydrolase [Bacteroidaceae bacterium]
MEEQFKVALFDVDGTLVDSEGQYSVFWGEMGRRYHPEMPTFSDVIKGTTLTQILDRYFPKEDHEEIVKELYAHEAQM